MIRITLALALALSTTGCGIDGEPTRPEPKQMTGGVAISGTAEVGVSGSF